MLSSKHSTRALQNDQENILVALAVHNHVQFCGREGQVHFVLQLVKSESKAVFSEVWEADLDCDLVVYEDLRLHLLAKSCIGGLISARRHKSAVHADHVFERRVLRKRGRLAAAVPQGVVSGNLRAPAAESVRHQKLFRCGQARLPKVRLRAVRA